MDLQPPISFNLTLADTAKPLQEFSTICRMLVIQVDAGTGNPAIIGNAQEQNIDLNAGDSLVLDHPTDISKILVKNGTAGSNAVLNVFGIVLEAIPCQEL